jgi:hypothetical protein
MLDGVVFEDVRLDKTTDFRGAKLMNLWDTEFTDVHGRSHPGTDWRLANYDETTQYIKDPTPQALKDVRDLLTILREDKDDPRAKKFEDRLRSIQQSLKKKYDADWPKKLKENLTAKEEAYLEEVYARAGDIVD